MALTIHVALFEDRHIVPAFVKEAIYDNKPGGWDIMDIWEFQRVALHKFTQWKYKGITSVNIYLSGLTSAVISALNAATQLGITVKLFHYSFLIDRWLPQPLEFSTPGCTLSTAEREMWKQDRMEKEKMTEADYREFCAYIKIYRDALERFRNTVTDWETIKAWLFSRIQGRPRRDYIELMQPWLCPKNIADRKEGSYNVRLREYITRSRQERESQPQQQPTRGGYCTKPPVKKYKKPRR